MNIEEAANKFEWDNKERATGDTDDLNWSFQAGVEFAQKWIPTHLQLPVIGVEMIVKNTKKKEIHTPLTHDDVHYLAQIYTHWRPIDLK